jgi:hypothetical protein
MISVALTLFFAPILFWFNVYYPLIATTHPSPLYSVYRSPSCIILGVGDIHFNSAFQATCHAPPLPM